MSIEPEAMQLTEAARYCGINPRTLRRIASDPGSGIAPRRLPTGGCRYLKSDLDRWLRGLPLRGSVEDRNDDEPVSEKAKKRT